jgi:hypothetical protein
MTQPTPESQSAFLASTDEVSADEQETLRLDQPDPDATRPMSLADLLDND